MMRRRQRTESYEAMRKRLIHETEVALLYGISFPQRVPRIPTVEVGKASFSRGYCRRYWQAALELSDREMNAWG